MKHVHELWDWCSKDVISLKFKFNSYINTRKIFIEEHLILKLYGRQFFSKTIYKNDRG